MGDRQEEQQNRPLPDTPVSGRRRKKEESENYLGCLSKTQLIILSAAVGVVLLLIIIIVPSVVLTKKPVPSLSFATGGDMLDYLIQSGDISQHDGLLATWFHRANSKAEMNKALASDVMILEADITLEGYGTSNVAPIPIMAHPPDVYSDNTLDQWLDAVLSSKKGIKLDFKTIESVGLSLDLLIRHNNSRGINRPVWLNADILKGPSVVGSPVNATRFLELVNQKFPDVTLSLGWKIGGIYTKAMVEEMYDIVKDVQQQVTFPVHALFVRTGWQHLSWLLSRSSRFSLTLWQGAAVHPTVNDLLFVRDNTHPARVYYDIYEPTLSAFKEAARKQDRLRRFYPGGDLMEFLYPSQISANVLSTDGKSQTVRWVTVTDQTSLSARLSDCDGGMLVLRVGSDKSRPEEPVVESSGESSESLKLQDVLQQLALRPDAPWGVYLQIQTQQLLEASLHLLQSAYNREELYRPVWIGVDTSGSSYNTEEFVSTVNLLFPHVTFVLADQTGSQLITKNAVSQRVALHLSAASLPEELNSLMDRYDLIVEDNTRSSTDASLHLKTLLMQHKKTAQKNLFIISNQS